MPSGGVSLGALGLIAGGAVLAYAGVNDPDGGPVAVVRDILQGKPPTPGEQKRSPGIGLGGDLGGAAGGAFNSLIPTVKRAQVIAVAQSYLGTPYRWGGSSKTGIDCSGLVLVAYRDGAGIKLPHLATAQAAAGTLIDRSQILAGDLVAWGVPGNYPHIALAMSADTVIAAPTWGRVVEYQKLWQKKVSGFGYPDIYRIGALG